jgi:hypothetical protein
MKDDILKGFEAVIAEREKRDAQAREASQNEASQLQQTQAEWSARLDDVVRPALVEIEGTLTQYGWMTRIQPDRTGELFFEVWKGNMRAVAGSKNHPGRTG